DATRPGEGGSRRGTRGATSRTGTSPPFGLRVNVDEDRTDAESGRTGSDAGMRRVEPRRPTGFSVGRSSGIAPDRIWAWPVGIAVTLSYRQ
ncbi:MAG: hypothetical protein DWI71_00095, partial [Chloroflexi bacterium]